MGVARKFSNIFRLINDLIAVNGRNDFESYYNKSTHLK